MNNRKDDHIREALNQFHNQNDFDLIRFVPESLCVVDIGEVDLSVHAFDRTFPYPIYINAMTGGSNQALEINRKLAIIARETNLPMASGSLSAALKNSEWISSFEIIRENNPNGFIFANIGLSENLEGAKKAVEMMQANALQIHLNAPQEITMPEGDRNFSHWPRTLKSIIENINVPIIVKEVGFGMSYETAKTLLDLGVKYIDVSGKGGTNFIAIENTRRKKPLQDFETYGFSTVESLLDIKHLQMTTFASGGIRGAYDIVKALALGAKMVGLSRYFLEIVTKNDLEEAIKLTKQLLEDIKMIMAVLNTRSLDALQHKPLLFDQKLITFIEQRKKSRHW
jgi:isopentenyl-diphosphate Delta-isomerase